jgi:hypothetical protein
MPLNRNAAYVDLALEEIADVTFRGNRALARAQTYLGTRTPRVLFVDATHAKTMSLGLDVAIYQPFYLR